MGEDFANQTLAFRDAVVAVLQRHGINYTEDPATSDRVLCVAERFVARGAFRQREDFRQRGAFRQRDTYRFAPSNSGNQTFS